MDSYVSKPIRPEDLWRAMHEALDIAADTAAALSPALPPVATPHQAGQNL